ncbi:DUF1254 domain-containing protein [Candidatus Viadribacter manganicus]|uniref:DUF1254 domain-containing protein n=1 Tax=Candidatus Viadribacter manganicus TaxID=1759059 RepID=A0A1B1AIP3_9PROT|nr:DUF1254 domain-containing protein [Candidatus Viadribacter manganicus]ANP46434.1 hypothetical protein ATE48_11155 [Candidatus Viadribacter manganicus]
MSWGKYILGALVIAVLIHFAVIIAVPRVLMNVAMERIGTGGENVWRTTGRVTAESRQIVRPSPDFAYSACVFDLSEGPVIITATPWDDYWSLSLYGANSDNFFVIDDREAHYGAEITLVRKGVAHPEGASMVVESPSTRGIALIRRLAPTPNTYEAAARVASEDVCTSVAQLSN